jgi:hypothetical protein
MIRIASIFVMKNKLLISLFMVLLYQDSCCMITIPLEWIRRKFFPPKDISDIDDLKEKKEKKLEGKEFDNLNISSDTNANSPTEKKDSSRNNFTDKNRSENKEDFTSLATYDKGNNEKKLIIKNFDKFYSLLEKLLTNKIQIDIYHNNTNKWQIDVQESIATLKGIFFELIFMSSNPDEPKVRFIRYILKECKSNLISINIQTKLKKHTVDSETTSKTRASLETLNALSDTVELIKNPKKSIATLIENFFNQFRIETILDNTEKIYKKQKPSKDTLDTEDDTKFKIFSLLIGELNNALYQIIEKTNNNKKYIYQKKFILKFLEALEAAKEQLQYFINLIKKLTKKKMNADRKLRLIRHIIENKSLLLSNNVLKIAGIAATVGIVGTAAINLFSRNRGEIKQFAQSSAHAAMEKAKEAWYGKEKSFVGKLQERAARSVKSAASSIEDGIKNMTYSDRANKIAEDFGGYDVFGY